MKQHETELEMGKFTYIDLYLDIYLDFSMMNLSQNWRWEHFHRKPYESPIFDGNHGVSGEDFPD